MPAGKARVVLERDYIDQGTVGAPVTLTGGAASTNAATLQGHPASDFLSPRYLTLQSDSNLTQERVFTPGYGLAGTDGGAGGTYDLSLHLRSPSGLVADASGLAVADTLAGSGLSMTDKVMAIKLQSPSGLTIDANGLAIDDTVAGNGLTITGKIMAVGTPSSVSSTSTNSTTADSHAHAATAYSDASVYPGHLLKSDASGYLKLVRLTATDRLRTSLIDSETGTNLKLAPAQDIDLQPGGTARVRTLSGVRLQSDNFASQTTGWAVAYSGAADFRYVYTDELHAKAFVADLEQALAGGQIISKSVAPLSRDFTAPAAGATADLWVECFQGFPAAEVFAAGDYVMLRQFDRSGGGLSITNCFGTVSAPYFPDPQSDPPEQRWTFTRLSGTVSGHPAAGYMEENAVVKRGTLALDFGVSGNGYHEVNAIDGLMGENSPYNQTVKWAQHPWYDRTVTTRTGNLKGIFNVTNEYGLYAGEGVTDASRYLRISSQAIEGHNLPIRLYDGPTQVVRIEPGTYPYIGLGNPAPTSYLAATGIWAGKHSSDYKMHVGTVSGGDVTAGWKWDGSTLTVRGNIYVGSSGNAAKTDLTNVAADTVVGKVNAGSTLINPGRILVSGTSTLESWRHPSDQTLIDGGRIYAHSVTAQQMTVTMMNMVDNPGFESGTVGWQLWAGSSIGAWGGHSGNNLLVGDGNRASGVNYAVSDNIPVYAGQVYYAEIWCYVSTGSRNTGMTVSWRDRDGANISYSDCYGATGTGWTRHSRLITAPANAAFAMLQLGQWGTPNAAAPRWDDVVFRPASGMNLLVGTPGSARVEINNEGIEGYSDSTTKQFYLRTSDGRAMFGGGKGVLDATGMVLSGNETNYNTYNAIRWLTAVDPPGGNEVARLYGGRIAANMPEAGIVVNPSKAYSTSYLHLQAYGPSDPSGYVEVLGSSSSSYVLLEARSTDALGASTASVMVSYSASARQVAINPCLDIFQGDVSTWIGRLRSSTVAHGITDWAVTDAFATFMKVESTRGGLNICGYTESTMGLLMQAAYTTDNTTKGASASAPVCINVVKKSGSGITSPGSDANIFIVRSNGTTVFTVDKEGDTFLAGNLYLNNYTARYLYVGGSPAQDLFWYNTKLNRAPGQAGDTGGITVVTGITKDAGGHVTGVTTRGLTFVDGIVTAVT